ncbi:unnamed protein product [Spirodela intermedia]|uniref:Uncharacterized protein n=2 Tax=Spirodela intermedia TaxID=51605 RepID=A0A7I8KM48_SPIIN|nr:unnamed protein product [Spirodela intermedia]CAA6661798.1 unnamed protein product [Spirodela intermedia]CAA7398168.1 unnamed protein product [Spirodela intermedia]
MACFDCSSSHRTKCLKRRKFSFLENWN